MARNRRAVLRRLSVEQQTFLLCGNLLTRAYPDESDRDAEGRLFGSRAAASNAWHCHREALLAEDAVAGRRPHGWWAYERAHDVPPLQAQPDVLRQLGELTELEEAQLEAWHRMVPEPPDLSLDHHAVIEITSTTEDTNDVEAQPEAGGGAPEVPAGHGAAGPPDEQRRPDRDAAEAPVAPDAPGRGARAKEVIELTPWYGQPGRPREIEGWE